jgi:8-oxo-dGTP pyrophosphatase MutT (NUDIX family)
MTLQSFRRGYERKNVQATDFGSGDRSHAELQVLLLERADRPGFWQSVTGSQHEGETLEQTALRELWKRRASMRAGTA